MRTLLLFMALLITRCCLAFDTSFTQLPDTLHTATGDLYGTLMLPAKTKGKVPVALLIAGSGPTDRDGNTPLLPGKSNSLLYLAQELAARGIATLRYDKRGIAASKTAMPREEDLRFDDYVADAASWLQRLKKDRRFSTLTVIGHSEGSLIGMLAAPGLADRVVSIAGAGLPADSLLRRQLATLPDQVKTAAYSTLDSLREGLLVKQPPLLLLGLFRPSLQPYMISWLRQDPRAAIAALKVPVLIVQGDNDVQVSVGDAESLKAAAPKAQLLLVKNMNHALKLVESRDPQVNVQAYSDPSLPLSSQLVLTVAAFIRKP